MGACIPAFALLPFLFVNSWADDVVPDAHPFNIKPKQEVISIAAPAKVESWRPLLNSWQLRFHSVDEFSKAVRQPSFQTLSSGKTELIYYAIFRLKPDILVFAYSFIGDEKSNGSVSLLGRNGAQSLTNELRIVDLLETTAQISRDPASLPSGTLVSESQTSLLLGYAARVAHGYQGPLILSYQLWNEARDKMRAGGSLTFNWPSDS